ncbi:MAG: class I SAM-dependent methyltransferase [Phycisphaerae bacterium]|nr:class I SAM-dependent methyltransferase [Phycisphaerae bacterium]
MQRDEPDTPLPRLYSEFAQYWRLMSAPEEYAAEAALWREAIRSRLGPGRHRMLELGVGGGHNMSHLTGDFDFTAADIAPAMIEQARMLNPGVEFHVGDMRTMRLSRTFDGVLIHDAIDYMRSEDDLRAVFGTAAAHLRPGGIFITSPDWFRDTFRDPQIGCRSNTDGQTELTYFEYTYDPDPSDTTIETLMWYLIREGGGKPLVEQDHHVLGLFPLATWERLMADAGFRVEKDPYDVGGECYGGLLLVGVWQG